MKKALFLCFAVVMCTAMVAQTKVSLKMNPGKNKIYRFSSVSEQTITQSVNGNQQVVETKSNYTASIKMIDATPTVLITEVHFDTLITKTNSMGKTTNISSLSEGNLKSAETSDILSYIMNQLTKNALYVKMDYTGKVLEVVNSKMLSDIIMKDTSSVTLTGPLAAAIKGQIKNLVSENTLKTMVEMFTYYVPGKDVSTGENWSSTITTNSGGMALDIITGYHLNGVNGNVADITAESEIKAAANAAPIVSGGATVTYNDLKGMSKSTLTIDISTGLLVETKGKTHIAGNLGVSAPGMSLQIPMDISSTSRVISLQ
jgi:hypothetical protein